MKIAINLFLLLAMIALTYLVIQSVQEPIKFQEEKTKRERAVISQLEYIRAVQLAYRDIKGEYAGDWDSLRHVLSTDSFMVIRVFEVEDVENEEGLLFDTAYVDAADSLAALGWNLDSLEYVPYSDGKKFDIDAGVIEYQATEVAVVEVRVRIADFMGQYAGNRVGGQYKSKYTRYDQDYNPNAYVAFGDMTRPTTAGNWRIK